MIRIRQGLLAESELEAIVRPVRTDLDPVNARSRDLGTAAGPKVEERLRRMESMPLGSAVITPAGELAASFLIHVVVMSADEATTSPIVQRVVKNALGRASDLGIESVSMPTLGLGVGNVDPEVAAQVLLELLANHVNEGASPSELEIVVSSDFEEELFTRLLTARISCERGKA